VVKHARRAEASVRVKAGADGMRITVTDTGIGGPARTAPDLPAPAGRLPGPWPPWNA